MALNLLPALNNQNSTKLINYVCLKKKDREESQGRGSAWKGQQH